ncbi:hypothetical protein B0H19DRAFT_1077908 [Mycena capillaripes]|nr:hypothetical protein B0H19DRAFT_1077908 [Mycena capillaripes]
MFHGLEEYITWDGHGSRSLEQWTMDLKRYPAAYIEALRVHLMRLIHTAREVVLGWGQWWSGDLMLVAAPQLEEKAAVNEGGIWRRTTQGQKLENVCKEGRVDSLGDRVTALELERGWVWMAGGELLGEERRDGRRGRKTRRGKINLWFCC